MGQDIDALVTASDVENARPEPDMIYKAMELLGITDSKAVAKVGDSQIDITEGQRANCGMTFGVTTGAQSESQLAKAGPTAIIDNLMQLLDHLQ